MKHLVNISRSTPTGLACVSATPTRTGQRSRKGKVAGALAMAMILAGCSSIDINPLSSDELGSVTAADRAKSREAVDAISGVVTLEEAIARALKFNLDRRVRMMEEAVAMGTYEAGKYDMLPKFLAMAGYRERSNDMITRSKDSVTGLPSLANPFISADRDSHTTDLGLTWSLLDFGTSYYGAKQNADRVLIAAERRRKAMHTLIQDVRSAYWRAASAQVLQERVRETIRIAEEALVDARKAEQERVRSPLDSLRYQRQVLENLRLLETAQQELATAHVELGQLINAPVGSNFSVTEAGAAPGNTILSMPVGKLEEIAVARNADVREQAYNVRIAVQETRRVMTRLFPNLTYNYDIKYDSNSYLINKGWNEVGLSFSFNLFNLLSGPTQKRLADAGVSLAEQRRMAMQIAVLTQVHIARLQYANALGQYSRANEIAGVDEKIGQITSSREQAAVQSKLEMVANRATTILSVSRRYQALSQAHIAASKLQATLGLDPELGSVQDIPLKDLSSAIRTSLNQWDAGRLPEVKPAKSVQTPAKAAPETVKQGESAPAADPIHKIVALPPLVVDASLLAPAAVAARPAPVAASEAAAPATVMVSAASLPVGNE